LRRWLPALLEDTPARLRQQEKRKLFAAFAYQEPVLQNKLLGLKFSEDRSESLAVISVSILSELESGRRGRLLALAG
jgi:hypothetical protein